MLYLISEVKKMRVYKFAIRLKNQVIELKMIAYNFSDLIGSLPEGSQIIYIISIPLKNYAE